MAVQTDVNLTGKAYADLMEIEKLFDLDVRMPALTEAQIVEMALIALHRIAVLPQEMTVGHVNYSVVAEFQLRHANK